MADELRPGALLRQGTYRIEKKLGQGGFGITYLGRDLSLDRPVAIKEFFPEEYCGREDSTSQVTTSNGLAQEIFSRYKAKFLKEARNIAKLNHPGIIKIYAAFEENGTAYYVMEYIEGMSLAEMVKARGSLSVDHALAYIKSVGETLGYVHANKMTHLDVKPANIMVRRSDNTPILIDFGLSKQYDAAGHQTSTTPAGISHGYAPLEQYIAGGVQKFLPQTDIYSLAATLYYLLSAETPPQAPQLSQEGLHFSASIPTNLRAAIATAMSSNIAQRYPTIAAFLAALSSTSQPQPTPRPAPTPDDSTVIVDPQPKPRPAPAPRPTPEPTPRRKSKPLGIPEAPKKRINSKFILWGGVGLTAVVVLITSLLNSNTGNNPAPTAVAEDLYYDEASSELVAGNNRYKMVYVEGGSFDMGATSEQINPDSAEMPVHCDTLSNYSIGRTEVPQWLWVAVMGNNPSSSTGDNLPVERVSWDDCQEFLGKLNALTGKSFRLPTEAQWEYAARGGKRSRGCQYSGSNNLGDVAWYNSNSGSQTHEVGTKSANELGLYDMSGNVWEWCNDWYGDYQNSGSIDPMGSSYGGYRVGRGGSWGLSPGYCRVAYRLNCVSGSRSDDLGFRLAM